MMKKLLLGAAVGLLSMTTLVSPAEAKQPDQPAPPAMTVTVTPIGCEHIRNESEKPLNNGDCTGRGYRFYDVVSITTVTNPAGHTPNGLNK